MAPRTVAIKICEKLVPRLLELLAIKAQPHQPDSEGEQLIVAVSFLHNGTPLGDGLGGNGEAQVDLGGGPVGIQGRIKAPPFDGAAVKDGM